MAEVKIEQPRPDELQEKVQYRRQEVLTVKGTKLEPVKIFQRPTEEIAKHLKPTYVSAHMYGKPVRQVLVDNGREYHAGSSNETERLTLT